jgi:hypothetical protein
MKFNVYYRSKTQKGLHKIQATTDSHILAIADVEEYISQNNIDVSSPVLVVIEGGVNGEI